MHSCIGLQRPLRGVYGRHQYISPFVGQNHPHQTQYFAAGQPPAGHKMRQL